MSFYSAFFDLGLDYIVTLFLTNALAWHFTEGLFPNVNFGSNTVRELSLSVKKLKRILGLARELKAAFNTVVL